MVSAGLHADVVLLKNGEQVSGKIIGRGADGVALQLPEGRITYFNAAEIRRIVPNVDSLDIAPPANPMLPAAMPDAPALDEIVTPAVRSVPHSPPPADAPSAPPAPMALPFDKDGMFNVSELTAGAQAQMAVGNVLSAIGGVAQLVASIIVIVAAFRDYGILKGILTICCWPYWLYFAIAHYQSPRKKHVMALFLVGVVLNITGAVLQQSVLFSQMGPILRNILDMAPK